MQQRAIDTALSALTGTALAGMLVAGVAVESAHSAPADKPMADTAAGQQHTTSHTSHTTSRHTTGRHTGQSKASGRSAGKTAAKTHAVLSGSTTASYFWDDGSGVDGDTGAPASGKPMQKGLFASPSWPLNTKVKVTYNGRSVTGFVGDRGPGEPSHRGVMLDLDTYTFRHLVDGKKPATKYDTGTSAGHLTGVKYQVLSWGTGTGHKGTPRPLG
jgi:rare lipoprotein A (peptidoglycan hydrolase)